MLDFAEFTALRRRKEAQQAQARIPSPDGPVKGLRASPLVSMAWCIGIVETFSEEFV
jgi:hypothetical protein